MSEHEPGKPRAVDLVSERPTEAAVVAENSGLDETLVIVIAASDRRQQAMTRVRLPRGALHRPERLIAT